MTKAYSYLRFSTPEQAKGDSHRRQLALAQQYAEAHALDLDDHSYKDLGVSAFTGKNANKGALSLFRRAIEDGLIASGSYLLVENLDRISRMSPWDAFPVFQEIANAGVIIVTLQDQKVWSKVQMQGNYIKFIEWMVVTARAHEESETKSIRMRAVQSKKRLQAATKRISTRGPAWLVASKDNERGWDVVPERADIIKRIFTLAAQGRGDQSIAVELNRSSVKTWGDSGRPPALMWHKSYIQKILSSQSVLGIYVAYSMVDQNGTRTRKPAGSIPDYYPVIITGELWNAVKALKTSHNPARGRHSSKEIQNVIGGIGKCDICNHSMTRVAKGKRQPIPKLLCTSVKNGKGCKARPVAITLIEKGIIEKMRKEAIAWETDAGSRWVASKTVSVAERIDAINKYIDHATSDEIFLLDDKLRLKVADWMRERQALVSSIQLWQPEQRRITSVVGKLREISRLLTDKNPRRDLVNALMRQLFFQVRINTEINIVEFEFLTGSTFSFSIEAIDVPGQNNVNTAHFRRSADGRFIPR